MILFTSAWVKTHSTIPNGALCAPYRADCEAEEYLKSFNENDDTWLNNKPKLVKPETKPVTIRLNVIDIQRAKKIASEKNVPYQTLLKEIIHKNLA